MTRLGRASAEIVASRDRHVTSSSSDLDSTLREPVEILQFGDERLEHPQRHHVGAVRWRMVRVLMGLDEDASDPNRHRRPRQHSHEGALSARGGPLTSGLLRVVGLAIPGRTRGVAGSGGHVRRLLLDRSRGLLGLVWLSVVAPNDARVTRSVNLPGGRTDVRDRATTVAMHLIRRVLLSSGGQLSSIA